MTVTNVMKDPDTLTVAITAEFDATIDQAWQLWENPRLLERWWGPPTYPATFGDHALTPGHVVNYFMTGPAGDRAHGWWRITSVDAPRLLEFDDGFADDTGAPNPAMPTMVIRVDLIDREGGGVRMVVRTTFPSHEAMEQVLAMGMDEGMTQAMNQIDDLLTEAAAAG
ncbi:MAG: SRPBCC domain-containing protein [Acidimicrobiia bacterium]|nr:SRPBCC domain-containing protein [Acidimicrobiia bacterium]